MDNVQSSDSKLSLDNAPTGMAPMEASTDQEQTPSESSGETPQNDAVSVESNESPTVGQTQETEEKPYDMPEKFQGKSAEEIAQSYQALESQNKKVEMERSDLEKLFVEKETDVAPATDAPTDTPAISEDVNTALKDLEPQLAKSVANMLAKPLAKLEVQDMLNKHGNAFTQKAKEVKDLQTHNPSLSMEDAFKIVSFDNVKRTSHTQGVNEATANQEAKKKAQVESSRPSGMRPGTADEALNNAKSPGEMANVFSAMGPEYSRFKEISERKARQLGGN